MRSSSLHSGRVCQHSKTNERTEGYARLTLEPGASKFVTFGLPVDQLAFYDTELKLVLEPGRIFVMVGASSADIRLTGEFKIDGKGKMPVKKRVFVCPVEVR